MRKALGFMGLTVALSSAFFVACGSSSGDDTTNGAGAGAAAGTGTSTAAGGNAGTTSIAGHAGTSGAAGTAGASGAAGQSAGGASGAAGSGGATAGSGGTAGGASGSGGTTGGSAGASAGSGGSTAGAGGDAAGGTGGTTAGGSGGDSAGGASGGTAGAAGSGGSADPTCGGFFEDPDTMMQNSCDTCAASVCCDQSEACVGDAECAACLDGTGTTNCDLTAASPNANLKGLYDCMVTNGVQADSSGKQSGTCTTACQGPIACDAPTTSPSAGSCATDTTTFKCNPLTNAGCTGNDTCDLGMDSSGTVSFSCLPPPNSNALCGGCGPNNGYCVAGNTCVPVTNEGGTCAHFCCDDGDCGSGHCDKNQLGLTGGQAAVGICLTLSTGSGGSSGSAGAGGG